MTKNNTMPTRAPRYRAFLVGVDFATEKTLLPVEDSLEELALLAETAGLKVVGEIFQKLTRPHGATYIGTGKLQEVIMLVEEFHADVIIFDNELSPRHIREIEDRLGEALGEDRIQILDRTALILDIFAMHANTSEGNLQVELAQYQYRLPRLTRAWTHLARQAGGSGGRSGSGGVGLRGPGETQLEMDRREILRRISFLKNELEKVRAHRARHRQARKLQEIPTVALVGYTNAGKSTLLNLLTDAKVYVADKLFATLDPTTRKVILPSNTEILLTDTVGFIQKLPTDLVAAFRATLEEINEADLLLHVIDISHPNAVVQYESVMETLREIDCADIPTLTILNKIDLLPHDYTDMKFPDVFKDPIFISAAHNIGLDELLQRIEDELFSSYIHIVAFIPYQEGQLISFFHENGNVTGIKNLAEGIEISGQLPSHLIAQFQPYIIKIQHKQRSPE
jgi:GTPase